jgi:hypothetical protein
MAGERRCAASPRLAARPRRGSPGGSRSRRVGVGRCRRRFRCRGNCRFRSPGRRVSRPATRSSGGRRASSSSRSSIAVCFPWVDMSSTTMATVTSCRESRMVWLRGSTGPRSPGWSGSVPGVGGAGRSRVRTFLITTWRSAVDSRTGRRTECPRRWSRIFARTSRGTRYTGYIAVEQRIQRDRNATLVEVGTVF